MSSQVQGTNDSSIVSKCSMVDKGYFKDGYIHYFVDKPARRSPLINIGYYVRAVVVNSVITDFLRNVGHKNTVQIVSFGAGFDTSYFRFTDLEEGANLIYYEVDLPDVVKRKFEYITRSKDLMKKLENVEVIGNCELRSSNYYLMISDLRDTSNTEKCLLNSGINFKYPTLFLSECSITYMDEESSTNLIKWAAKVAENATFITYEQITPHDGFGLTMIKHFNSLQSPLLSVSKYPTLDDQKRRYIEQSWERCEVKSAWNAFTEITAVEERRSILSLEPFDEWEEWHLKCNHYVLVVARNGSLCDWLPPALSGNLGDIGIDNCPSIEWKLHLQPNIQRYGHTSILFGQKQKYIVTVGGFGRLKDGSHKRLKTVTCINYKHSFGNISSLESGCDAATLDCMHHSCTVLYHKSSEAQEEVGAILYGGRTSPMTCVNQIPVLFICTVTNKNTMNVKCDTFLNDARDGPEPRWRHSACLIENEENKTYVVFGGCSTKLKIFGDLWTLDVFENEQERRWKQNKSKSKASPCARFSHSVAVWKENMIISGGIGQNLEVLSDIWMWDSKSRLWTELEVKCLKSRYGHTSTIIDDTLILVGGVTTLSETCPGVAVVQLKSYTCCEYKLPVLKQTSSSIMLHNHSTVLLENENTLLTVGGGGNCFSFGTAFNSCLVEIPLQQFK